jgi:WD40 repeat protein
VADQYDVFISYNRHADETVAALLQRELQRFAKPVFSRRALRVFRDDANLSANPGLWTSIQQGLDASGHLLVLASTGAAASPWVVQEIEHWRRTKPDGGILLVVTDGEVGWDGHANDFAMSRSTAIPASLSGAFAEEPRYVDLRWMNHGGDVNTADPRLADAIADLAAPLHHRSKDDLVGEDLRQHRRLRRLTRAAVAVLAALTIAAVVGAIVALDQRSEAVDQREEASRQRDEASRQRDEASRQRDEAERQRDEATRQARIALARQLAAQSSVLTTDVYDRSLLLGVAALDLSNAPETRGALLSALEAEPGVERFISLPEPATDVAVTRDGRVAAIGDATGAIRLWELGTGEPIGDVEAHDGRVNGLAFSPDGRHLVSGGSDGSVTVWTTGGLRAVGATEVGGEAEVRDVALDPSGVRGAIIDSEGTLTTWDVATGAAIASAPTDFVTAELALDADGTTFLAGVTPGGVGGNWRLAGMDSAGRVGTIAEDNIPFAVHAFTADRTLVGRANAEGEIAVDETISDRSLVEGVRVSGGDVEALAFSPDASLLAVSFADTTVVIEVASGDEVERLDGMGGTVRRVLFTDADSMLAVSEDHLAVWTLGRSRRMGTTLSDPSGDVPRALLGGEIVTTADGRLAAWNNPHQGDGTLVWDLTNNDLVADLPWSAPNLAFSPDRTQIAIGEQIWSLDGTRVADLSPPFGGSPFESGFVLHGTALLRAHPVFEGEDVTFDVTVVDLATGAPVDFLTARTDDIVNVLLTPEEQVVVGHRDGTIDLVDGATGETLAVVDTGSAQELSRVALSPDRRRLAVASADDTVVTVWDVERGTAINTIGVGQARAIALDGDGTLLATGRRDGRVVLWDVASGIEIAELSASEISDQDQSVDGLSFVPGGETLLSFTPIGRVVSWDLAPRVWRERACVVAGRTLTETESRLYLGARSGARPCDG